MKDMQCHEAEGLLIDFLDDQLSSGQRADIEKHLADCPSCRHDLEEYRTLFQSMSGNKLETPGPMLRENFNIMLQSELNILAADSILKEGQQGKVVAMKKPSTLWLRIAASIILIACGFMIGSKVRIETAPDNVSQIADLKKEVIEMKESLMFNLLNDESASERIRAVNYVDEMANPDSRIISALFNTLNRDKNVNVRLAALYSVAKFSGSQMVRDSLVTSLSRQTEPLIQIVLINILTDKKETKAVGPIKEIISNKQTLPPVREAAQKGLKLL